MASWRLYVAAFALCCASVLGQNGMPPSKTIPVTPKASPVSDKTSPLPLTIPSIITTSAAPETTAAPPKTTTKSPTTTNPPPETTTLPPKTTTTPPKTTNPPPETTTVPPTTTVAPPPPKPTPPSAPETGLWNYTDSSTNITCIMLQMALQFNLSYAAGKETKQAVFNLPKDSEQTGGSCGNSTQTIILSWPKDSPLDKRNNFTLQYALNDTSKQYYASQVTVALKYDADIFPNATSEGAMELRFRGEEWLTGVSYSYRCKQSHSIKLAVQGVNSSNDNVAGEIIVSDVQEEAFRSVKGHQFSIAADCAPVDVPDVVPIAVGCALGGLVLVVLAAYLVGRRRSQARGYLSM